MKIAIYSRLLKKVHVPIVQQLIELLEKKGAQLFIFEEYYKSWGKQIKFQSKLEFYQNYHDFKIHNIDFFITLGGDGTILDAVTIVRDTGVPIAGINLGRLGFLAMIEQTRLEMAIDAIYSNSFVIDPRTLLYLESSETILL